MDIIPRFQTVCPHIHYAQDFDPLVPYEESNHYQRVSMSMTCDVVHSTPKNKATNKIKHNPSREKKMLSSKGDIALFSKWTPLHCQYWDPTFTLIMTNRIDSHKWIVVKCLINLLLNFVKCGHIWNNTYWVLYFTLCLVLPPFLLYIPILSLVWFVSICNFKKSNFYNYNT